MNIQFISNQLVITFSFWEKIWSLHGNFKIPRSNVTRITEGNPKSSWFDLRIPGTFFPGLIRAGTFLTRSGREFWYVTHNHAHTYTIELRDMSYNRLVLGSFEPIRI